jgi:hypothetical protein
MARMQKSPETFFNIDELEPSLRAAFAEHTPNPKKALLLAVPVADPKQRPAVVPKNLDRNEIIFVNDGNASDWRVESLSSLFRGDRQPPHLGDYPEAYQQCFMLLDIQFLQLCDFIGDRRDTEMLEVFSTLRRRPEGRSLGFGHDYMWQAAALMLGTTPLSQAEFEAILSRLERSCRTFEMGPTSRNYAAALRETIGQGTTN